MGPIRRYQRAMGLALARIHHPLMDDLARIVLTLVALADGTVLYALMAARRTHQRRLKARLDASRHLYGVVRITLADRRTA
jgi:hypothetical protein